jgi:hypothetical protein
LDKPLIVVIFSVPPDEEPAFNVFYHHRFLPRLCAETPEIESIRRYEEYLLGGSARWYNKQFVTFYVLTDEAAMGKADEIFARPAVKEVVAEFGKWKQEKLKNFSRVTYKPSWFHRRNHGHEVFSGPLFMWQLEMKPDKDREFQQWYEREYLPLQIAEIPSWSGARRYESVGHEPLRHLTLFEASDESTMQRCITDLRAPHRNQQNFDWLARVEAAVTWHDASSYRPIFRWPD